MRHCREKEWKSHVKPSAPKPKPNTKPHPKLEWVNQHDHCQSVRAQLSIQDSLLTFVLLIRSYLYSPF